MPHLALRGRGTAAFGDRTGLAFNSSTNARTSSASTPGASARVGGAVVDARWTTLNRTGARSLMDRRKDANGPAMDGWTVLEALHSTIHRLPLPPGKRKIG